MFRYAGEVMTIAAALMTIVLLSLGWQESRWEEFVYAAAVIVWATVSATREEE